MDLEHFKELCALYFINALDEEELREFKTALSGGDEQFIKTYKEFKMLSQSIPLGVESAEPPSRVLDFIAKRIRLSTDGMKPKLVNRLLPTFSFMHPHIVFSAMVILLMLTAVLTYQNYYKSVLLEKKENLLVELKGKLQQDEALMQVLAAKNVALVVMNGTEVNTAGFGKILWDQDKSTAILNVANLPPTASDKDYQLWIIKDNKPLSNGVFSISAGQPGAFFKLTNLVESNSKSINAFAVTLEPKGGVPQPTGKMFLLGAPAKAL